MSEKPAEDICPTCQQSLDDSVVIEKMARCSKVALNAQAKQVNFLCANMMILL